MEYPDNARPADWPLAGPIDLALHDPPHRSAAIEWWYTNAHLRTLDGRELSVFASFFRTIKSIDKQSGVVDYAHSVTWAVSDLASRRYLHTSWIDRDAPRLGLDKLERGEGSRDPRLRRAIREMLVRGSVPRPDAVFAAEPTVQTDRLDLDFSGARFSKNAAGEYVLTLPLSQGPQSQGKASATLVFTPRKAPVRHGSDGVVTGVDGADMFYYFVPRCAVRGEVRLDEQTFAVEGEGWYDHEFGGGNKTLSAAPSGAVQNTAWNWLAVQLDDGREVSAYEVVDLRGGGQLDKRALVIDADGTRHEYRNVQLSAEGAWRSTRTFNTYPTRFRVVVPEADLDLSLESHFADQEFVTLISKPAFWEGRVEAHGRLGAGLVRGRGYVERSGFPTVDTLDEFFSAVGEEVRASVQRLLPLEPAYEPIRDLVASEERNAWMEGVDLEVFVDSMAKPVRAITDRGGKSWRSYAALACCDIVGGDSRKYVEWLAMPEFMHVGSLIVDDVQDGSEVRRGGPACHVVYGVPLAINAGTACYFLGQKLLQGDGLTDKQKLRLYDLYFEALRAGHAGQAFDLFGLTPAMDEAVRSGDAQRLEARVLAIHRLKTAAPAASLARMGAVAGGGSEAQIDGLGAYFESVGLAFQIIDDVLNLRGFKNELKSRGEDLRRGVVTMPLVKAIGVLDLAERTALWQTVRGKPQDDSTVLGLIDRLEKSGAIDACVEQAHRLVEDAWRALDPLVQDSLPKLMLRAFGWYVLERQY